MRPEDIRLGLRALVGTALALSVVGMAANRADAQQLTRPVYRVANADAASTPAAAPAPASTPAVAPRQDAAVTPAAAQAPTTPFDLEKRGNEHPLMPCLRLAKGALAEMDARVQDYSATFTKVERMNGRLGDPQKLQLRVRHQPFSVYMKFITPKPGQEALYVANQNDGKLIAMGSGIKRHFGKIKLDPEGTMAMSGQRYPITKAGIKNLTAELVMIAEQDVKYAECEVRHATATVAGRQATMIESIHPVPRKNFRYHKAQIFIDNELRLPIAYQAYSWPTEASGGKPILEEKYIYSDLKINNGFTDADFSPEGPGMFK
ncbi:hypothetical protein MalM25_12140 [Planctomycetes bacterium MalM25]|nr:hypothetical protein MalM25_12140 [Planctomycetes bacterium MalM25]